MWTATSCGAAASHADGKRPCLLPCSPALKKLVAMVGGSFTIYKGIVDLCVAKYRDSEALYVGLKETAYCSLRSQLLMALHDAGANELCSRVGLLEASCIAPTACCGLWPCVWLFG